MRFWISAIAEPPRWEVVQVKQIDVSRLTPVDSMRGEDDRETREFQELHRKAEDFLGSFAWCGGIKTVRFGFGVSSIVAVFLFEIQPQRLHVDDLLWVVVGDIPSAYLVTDDAPNPAHALQAYFREMRRWVEAVRSGGAVSGLIPVDAPPTSANAEDLTVRLDFIQRNILERYRDEL
jgi:hypothetical protein